MRRGLYQVQGGVCSGSEEARSLMLEVVVGGGGYQGVGEGGAG